MKRHAFCIQSNNITPYNTVIKNDYQFHSCTVNMSIVVGIQRSTNYSIMFN